MIGAPTMSGRQTSESCTWTATGDMVCQKNPMDNTSVMDTYAEQMHNWEREKQKKQGYTSSESKKTQKAATKKKSFSDSDSDDSFSEETFMNKRGPKSNMSSDDEVENFEDQPPSKSKKASKQVKNKKASRPAAAPIDSENEDDGPASKRDKRGKSKPSAVKTKTSKKAVESFSLSDDDNDDETSSKSSDE